MWPWRKNCSGGNQQFFRVGLSHESLNNYYQTNFALMQHHKYSLTELDEMMPWERGIYINLLMNYLEKENEKFKNQQKMRK